MISFRYHIVSIVAVFLALALGIVVGTTALNGPITKDLRSQVNDAKAQRDTLANQVKTLQGQVDDAGQFASTYGAQLVAGKLTDKTVLVISMPGVTAGMQDGVTKQVTAAGGKIGSTVSITSSYLDASQSGGISALATGPSRPLSANLPETSDARKLGAAVLGYVLAGKAQKTDVTAVIAAFSQLHMVSIDSSTVTPSPAIIVLAKGKLTAQDYGAAAELDLVQALNQNGAKIVVAGDPTSATGTGLVAATRNTAGVRESVSSVDNADGAFGQVSTVLTLSSTAKGQSGHYGTGQGASALFPAPSN